MSLQRGTDQCDNICQETERGPQWFNGQGHCGWCKGFCYTAHEKQGKTASVQHPIVAELGLL